MNQNDLELSRNDIRPIIVQPARRVTDEEEIDLIELALGVLRDWKLLVAATLLCALLGAAAVKVLPQEAPKTSYTASSTVYLAKKDIVSDANGANAMDTMMLYLLNNTRSAYNPAQDFQAVIMSNVVLQKVIDDLNLDMGIEALEGRITLPDEKNTRLVRVNLDYGDAERAREILEHLLAVSIDSLTGLMEGESLAANYTEVTLREQTQSAGRFSGKKLVVLGGAVGFLIVAMLSALLTVLDRKIKNAEDVERYIGLPIVAVVTQDKG